MKYTVHRFKKKLFIDFKRRLCIDFERKLSIDFKNMQVKDFDFDSEILHFLYSPILFHCLSLASFPRLNFKNPETSAIL